MSAAPPPGWSPQGVPYHGPAPFPGAPQGPFHGPPGPGAPPPPAAPPPPTAPRTTSGPAVVLIIVGALVLLAGGAGAYVFLTRSSAAYAKVPQACPLVPPSAVVSLVPVGVADSRPAGRDGNSASCSWSNEAAAATGTLPQTAHMLVAVTRFTSDGAAHKWFRFQAAGANISAAGSPISGYGDEAYRMPKSYGDTFDELIFRTKNLFVEVGVGLTVTGHDLDLPGQAWERTRRAAAFVQQRLAALRQNGA